MQVDGPAGGAAPPTGPRGGSGRGRGRGFANVTRPGPFRANAPGAHRATPYTNNRPAPHHTPTPAPVVGKWSHDLFGDSSSLYNPQVNLEIVALRTGKVATPSPSLRPFGAATPAPTVPQSSLASTGPIPIVPPTGPRLGPNSGPNLFSRIGIRGMSGEAEKKAQALALEREKANREKAERIRKEQEAKLREEQEVRDARTREIAAREADGFVVQVEGLVFGTSAEDVQTAFSAYGDTSYCFVVNEATATEEDDLIARLVFERKKDAEQACQKLNGAIADGKPLKVQLVPATLPPPAILPPTPTGPRAGPVIPSGPRNNTFFPPRAPRLPAPLPRPTVAAPVAPPPVAPQRTMYADDIEQVNPRLAPSDGMDVDMADDTTPAPAVPTGPAALRGGGRFGGRGGRGGGRGGFQNFHQQQPQQQQQPQSLLSRFGAAPVQAPGGGGKSGGSLLARLG